MLTKSGGSRRGGYGEPPRKTLIAFSGDVGHNTSHAPQPMHLAGSTRGSIVSPSAARGVEIASYEHARVQTEHSSPFTRMQVAGSTRARPMTNRRFSSNVSREIAPLGQTSVHARQSSWQ